MTGVLLATDGSDHAKQAGARAIELAQQHGVPLHVLCVIDRREFGETALGTSQLATIEAEDRGHGTVNAIAEQARAAGLEVETCVCHGIPEATIVDQADDIDADVIVMGQHGDHTMHTGGVARRVRRRSDRETVLVSAKRPA